MAPVLSYERPTYAEDRHPPPALRRALVAFAAVLAAVAIVLVAVLHRRLGWSAAGWLTAGPTIGIATLILCGAMHGRTLLFADRLEVSLHWAGLRLWRRRVPWPTVTRCDAVRAKWGGGYKVWGRGPGSTVVMFGGTGVRLHLTDFAELAIGSADPDRLAGAINVARADGLATTAVGST